MTIVEYWMHSGDGALDCREGREWRTVRREIAEAQANPTPKGEGGLVWVERVERTYETLFDSYENEYEEMWVHPDFDVDTGEWKE